MPELVTLVSTIDWPVHLAIAVAAVLQGITGIGFGLIAGPALLVATADTSAIVTSMLLSLVTAILLAPVNLRNADYKLLRRLSLWLLIGAPFGALAFTLLSLAWLKALSALAIVFMLLLLHGRQLPTDAHIQQREWPQRITGFVSGVMASALGMPGPAVAAMMSAGGWRKQPIRATTLTLFLIAYPIAVAVQAVLVGLSTVSFVHAGALLPATALGTLTGWWLSGKVSETAFRNLVKLVLVATLIMLLA